MKEYKGANIEIIELDTDVILSSGWDTGSYTTAEPT